MPLAHLLAVVLFVSVSLMRENMREWKTFITKSQPKWAKAFKKLQVCQKAKAIHRFGLSHSWDLQMMNKYDLVSEKQKDMIEYVFCKVHLPECSPCSIINILSKFYLPLSSIYPAFIWLLSCSYSHFIRLLSGFYPAFIQLLSGFYPAFIRLVYQAFFRHIQIKSGFI